MVVEVEVVADAVEVFAGFTEFGELSRQPRLGFDIAGGAVFHVAGPLGDFPWLGLGGGVGSDPFEDFAIAFTQGELFLQLFGIDAGELQDVLIQRAGIMKVAIGASDGGAAFVQHAWQEDVTAETDSRAARGAFGEVWSVSEGAHLEGMFFDVEQMG